MQGPRSQCWGPFWPSCWGNPSMVCVINWLGHELCRVFSHLACRMRKDLQAQGLANVSLHMCWCKFTKFCKYWGTCDMCEELPWKPRNHAWTHFKGYVGLSGAVFTQLYLAIYGDDSKSLILLIGWLLALISMVFVYTIRTMKVSSHPNELKVFYEYLYKSIALALCLMGLTIAQKQVAFSHYGYVGSCVTVCVLIFLPLVIAIREELATWRQKRKPVDAPNRITVDGPPLPESKPATIFHVVERSAKTQPEVKITAYCKLY